MRAPVFAIVSIVSLALGGIVGFVVGQAPSHANGGSTTEGGKQGERRPASDSSSPRGSSSRSEDRGSSSPRRARRLSRPSVLERESNEREGTVDEAERSAASEPSEGSLEDRDPKWLSQELTACLEERTELLGTPIELAGAPEDRFTAQSLSSGVGSAIDQAGVAGEVEATDCSEHPCIVFGRLAGDEEDMEKIERTKALSPYDGDVLSLLFWATSVDDPSAPAHETGLFALAFYTDADRQEHGEELDRRIRARVMEYWNTDKPGLPNGAD